MSHDPALILERLLRGNGLGWMIDKFPPRERAIADLLERLERIQEEFQRRIRDPVSFSPQTLEAEARRNPQKINAFLQAVGTSRSPAMLVMVWRILQGMTIKDVIMDYHEQQASFRLAVTLARPEDAQTEEYESSVIYDAALVRHFGITMATGRPLFDGFFPMRQKQDPR